MRDKNFTSYFEVKVQRPGIFVACDDPWAIYWLDWL